MNFSRFQLLKNPKISHKTHWAVFIKTHFFPTLQKVIAPIAVMQSGVDLHRKGIMTMRRVLKTARMMKIWKNRRLKLPQVRLT